MAFARLPRFVGLPLAADAEGARTFLPRFQLVAALRAKRTPEPEILRTVKAAFAAGTFTAPIRPGVIYMLSPHNVVTIDEDKGSADRIHVLRAAGDQGVSGEAPARS